MKPFTYTTKRIELFFTCFVILFVLLINPFGYDLYDQPRLVLLEVFVPVLLLFAFRSVIFNQERSQTHTYALYPLLVFIVWSIFSVAFSDDPGKAFFGTFGRKTGYLVYLYGFILMIGLMNLREYLNTLKMIKVLAVSSLPVAGYALLQAAGLDLPGFGLPAGRVFGTFGNPVFLGSYFLLVIPLISYLYFSEKRGRFKNFYLLILFCVSTGLFLTLSKVAIFVFLAFIPFYLLMVKNGAALKYDLVRFAAVCLIVIAVSAASVVIPGRTGILAPEAVSGSFQGRFALASAALKASQEKPLTGWGFDNFAPAYMSVRGTGGPVFTEKAIPDKAHNLALDILAETGYPGLLSFLWLICLLFAVYFRFRKRNEKGFLPASALLLSIAGFLFSLLFSFFTPATFILFCVFLVLYFLETGLFRELDLFEKKIFRRAVYPSRFAILILISGAALYLFYTGMNGLRADTVFAAGLDKYGEGNTPGALDDYRLAAGIMPGVAAYQVELGKTLSEQAAGSGRMEYFTEAETAFNSAIAADHFSPEAYYHSGKMYLMWAEAGDGARRETARTRLRQALKLDESAEAYYELGMLSAAEQRYPEAAGLWLKAAGLDPEWVDPFFSLGIVYEKLGDNKKALEYLNKALKLSGKDEKEEISATIKEIKQEETK